MEVGDEVSLLVCSKDCEHWTCEPREAIAASNSEISSTNPAKKLKNHKSPLVVVLINQVQRRLTDQFLLTHRP